MSTQSRIWSALVVISTTGLVMMAGLKVGTALVADATTGDTASPSRAETAVAVRTMRIERTQTASTITAYGRINAGRSHELRAPAPGAITRLAPGLKEGAEVRAGAVLFEIDPAAAAREVSVAQALLAQAEVERDAAKSALPFLTAHVERAQTSLALHKSNAGRKHALRRKDLTSQSTLDQAWIDATNAERDHLQAREALVAGSSRLARAEASVVRAAIEVEQKRHLLHGSVVTAPFAGRLADVAASAGRYVAANEKLAVLLEISTLEAEFKVRISEYARLMDMGGSDGLRSVRVTARLDLQGRSFDVGGHIVRDAARSDPGAGGRTLFAQLDVPTRSPLRPGDFVTVSIEEPASADLTVLPESSLGADGTILVVDDDRRLTVAKVSVVHRRGANVGVHGAPLGKEVVVERTAELKGGLLVAPKRIATTTGTQIGG